MTTSFDVLTVASFLGLVIAFFRFTDRENRTLFHFVLAGVVFAIANQIGNAGAIYFGIVLVLAGVGYATLVTLKR